VLAAGRYQHGAGHQQLPPTASFDVHGGVIVEASGERGAGLGHVLTNARRAAWQAGRSTRAASVLPVDAPTAITVGAGPVCSRGGAGAAAESSTTRTRKGVPASDTALFIATSADGCAGRRRDPCAAWPRSWQGLACRGQETAVHQPRAQALDHPGAGLGAEVDEDVATSPGRDRPHWRPVTS
jgi:hypothetical protein